MTIISFPSKPARRAGTALMLLLFPQLAVAQECKVDLAMVEKSIGRLETSYDDILSDISCDAPVERAHQLMCQSSEKPDGQLWRMGRLDDLAWVYAYENATRQEVDRSDPPRDAAFIAKRDTCVDAQCLCSALVAHTNDSLGGESPYSGGK